MWRRRHCWSVSNDWVLNFEDFVDGTFKSRKIQWNQRIGNSNVVLLNQISAGGNTKCFWPWAKSENHAEKNGVWSWLSAFESTLLQRGDHNARLHWQNPVIPQMARSTAAASEPRKWQFSGLFTVWGRVEIKLRIYKSVDWWLENSDASGLFGVFVSYLVRKRDFKMNGDVLRVLGSVGPLF